MNPTLVGFMKKELRQALRDRRMRVVIFAIPLLQMTLFGLALSNEAKNIRLAVRAAPGDRLIERVRERALASGWFRGAPDDGRDPVTLLEQGRADAVLIAPAGGAARAAARGRGEPQLLVDATNALRARAVENYVNAVLARVAAEDGAPPPALAFDVRTLYNPTLVTSAYLIPGVMAMILCLVTILLTSMSLARERETGTLETLWAAPVRRWEIFLGKTLPFLALGLVNVPLLLGAAKLIFDVPLRGPLAALGAAAVTFLFATLSLGTLISTFARNQQQAMMGSFLFLFPAIQLSGVMAPLDNLPLWAKPFAWLNPLQYYVSLNRQVMLRGVIGPLYWSELTALALLGAVFAALAVHRFRRGIN